MILGLTLLMAATQWTAVTYHEACLNGWAELADFRRRGDAELVGWFRDQCADTRVVAYVWLQRSGPPRDSAAVLRELEKLEETWVAESRALHAPRPRRKGAL
jgi:hypothetical protein